MGTLNKTTQQLNDILGFIEGVPSSDDKGIKITGGQLEVGSPDAPNESVFGEGDSYPVPIAFHCDTSNESGLTITGATDVTTILQSDSGSTTGLFGGTSVGSFILVGSDHPFGGSKVKNASVTLIPHDDVVGRYLLNNTPTWIDVNYMVSDANFPYEQRANNIGGCLSCSEQWRFGFDPDNLPTTWGKVILNINGTNYEKYWARFEVTATLASDLVVEQLKLHTNRFEINADGATEYFGRSRYAKDLTMHWHLTEDLQGFSPSNENIDFASNLQLKFTDNEFSASATDGRGGYLVLPEGIDTSIPLKIEVLWIPEGSGTGDVVYEFLDIEKRVGDIMDTSSTANSTVNTVSLSNQLHELQKTDINVNISDLVPGEILGFGVKRLGTNALDTFSSSVSLINIRAVGYFWKP